jgi:hypothetical protein
VAQSKNCPFGVNTTIELKNITITPDNTGIQRGMLQLTSVPVVIFYSSVIVLTSNVNFWVVPLMHSVRDISNVFGTLPICTELG